MTTITAPFLRTSQLSDDEVLEKVRGGDTAFYEILMRRYNQRLYRITRGILGSDAEAEDVMQETYVRAFFHLDQFEGRSQFATWLTRIAVHEALGRVRRRARFAEIDDPEEGPVVRSTAADPERQAWNAELRRIIEAAVDTLPAPYRVVFVLREMEGLDTAETAECLGITTKTAKIRLHRARAFLRRALFRQTGADSLYPFHLSRCDRVVAGVFARISPA